LSIGFCWSRQPDAFISCVTDPTRIFRVAFQSMARSLYSLISCLVGWKGSFGGDIPGRPHPAAPHVTSPLNRASARRAQSLSGGAGKLTKGIAPGWEGSGGPGEALAAWRS